MAAAWWAALKKSGPPPFANGPVADSMSFYGDSQVRSVS
jgi:hypothetical protein